MSNLFSCLDLIFFKIIIEQKNLRFPLEEEQNKDNNTKNILKKKESGEQNTSPKTNPDSKTKQKTLGKTICAPKQKQNTSNSKLHNQTTTLKILRKKKSQNYTPKETNSIPIRELV